MPHAAVRLAPLLFGAVLVMAACSPACATSGTRSQAESTDALTQAPKAGAPDGFLAMEVMGVLPTSEGNAVFLVSEDEQVVLPIFIGGSEALAIELRLERRRFERPLTHDLLDTLVKDLGGHVTQVQVDDLRGATFVGTIYVSSGDHVLKVDARPSDAIALAIGNQVPIFVSRQVVERAGLTTDDLEEDLPPPGEDEEPPALEAKPSEPERPPLELREPLDPSDMVLEAPQRLEI